MARAPAPGPGRPTLLVAGTAAVVAATPAAIIAALAATDRIPHWIALLAALVIAATGLLAGLAWYRDLARLSRALDRAEAGEPPDQLPRLPPLRACSYGSAWRVRCHLHP